MLVFGYQDKVGSAHRLRIYHDFGLGIEYHLLLVNILVDLQKVTY